MGVLTTMRSLALCTALALALAATAAAELPAGDEVAARINARDDGGSLSQVLEMDLIAKDGSVRTRTAKVLRRWFDGEKRLVFTYLAPTTIRDTAFLVHDFPDVGKDDAQWLYLPALRKSRRIAARDRGQRFLGTDLSYEDMKNETRVSAGDYTWKTLREEACGEHRCLVVEATPRSDDIAHAVGYGGITYWVDSAIWIARKAAYVDPGGRALKTAEISEIREVDGIWTAHRIEVADHQSGHRTVMRSSEVDYASEIREDRFTERALRRGSR